MYRSRSRVVLIVTVILNLGLLFFFKYLTFSLSIISLIFRTQIVTSDIALPIGISFFTFQGISYVIDVYRNDVPVQTDISKVALYIVLFPQLIAGPIVRYQDIEKELFDRQMSVDQFAYGIERFIIGLSKKMLIANTMGALVDSVWNRPLTESSSLLLWINSIAYTLQIYFDFSGYSDMAIGLGRMLGFHFNENFDLPYTSSSISEFWRRWHISLSGWFRDYLYIPLGGNRKHVYLNLAIVFLLTGIWHGAAFNFIFWGIWNAVFILIERFLRKKAYSTPSKITSSNNTFMMIISKVYTLFVVNIGWIIFRGEHMSMIIQYLKIMFGVAEPSDIGYTISWYLDKWTIFIMVMGIIISSSIPSRVIQRFSLVLPRSLSFAVKYVVLIILLFLSILRIVSGSYNPFIYFRF